MLQKDITESFYKYALKKVYFYIESKYWSKLEINTLHNWIGNFKSDDEKYCALKLLDRFVYYSEEDIVKLLDFGLHELILKRYVFKDELSNEFTLSNERYMELKNNFFSSTFLLPLISDNLSSSSLAMLRYLTIDLGFPEENILNLNNIDSKKLSHAKNIIIVDDFIGTGNQLLQFWKHTKIRLDNEDVFVSYLKGKFPKIEFEYFCLVSTEQGLENIYSENIGLRITYCEMLSDKFKVFSKNSVYFNNDEVDECRSILEKLCIKNNIDLLGYNSLDYAIAFHHSIPDSSLPLFFKETETWNYLFKSKQSKTSNNV